MKNPTTGDDNDTTGLTTSSVGGHVYTPKMKNGLTYTIHQEEWNVKADYYLETFAYHLGEIIADLKQAGNPVKRVLELGIAKGVLSIGIALLTEDDTRIVGIDIQENTTALVDKNASANGVKHKIEVRIGNLFEPVKKGEHFDLVIGELPMMPIDPLAQKTHIEQGYAAEILNISGGADGRYFIDTLISQGSEYLNPNGAIVFIQPSFIGVEKTLKLFTQHGLEGSVIVSKEWQLNDTKFARQNQRYIETIHNYTFPKNQAGEEVFFLNIMRGVKK